jgi:N-formylmaleamate deformylase
MFKYRDDYVKVNGINIHYYRTGGNKPPFVLLHGATDNGLCWNPVAELLAEKYDVIMPDAQGHGLSDRLDRDFTFNHHTSQVVALTQELNIGEPVIMGHSMGAGTTVNIAVEYPSLPKAIILEDPAWGVLEPPKFEKGEGGKTAVEDPQEHLTWLSQRTLEEILEEGRKLHPSWSEEERLPWARSKKQVDVTLFSRPLINQRSYEELVPQIRCPTLLIISDDGLVPVEAAKNAARLWNSEQRFQWIQIKGAGHNIRREQFRAFCDALFRFLESLPD